MAQARKPAPPRPAGADPRLPDFEHDRDEAATDETTKVGPMTALIAEMMLQEEEAAAGPAGPQSARGRIAARQDDAAALAASRLVHVSPSQPPPPPETTPYLPRSDVPPPPATTPYLAPSRPPPPPPFLAPSQPPPAVAPRVRDSMPTPPRSVNVSSFPIAGPSETTAEELYLMRKRRAPMFILIGAILLIGTGIALALTQLQ